jgi:hypothetical protein
LASNRFVRNLSGRSASQGEVGGALRVAWAVSSKFTRWLNRWAEKSPAEAGPSVVVPRSRSRIVVKNSLTGRTNRWARSPARGERGNSRSSDEIETCFSVAPWAFRTAETSPLSERFPLVLQQKISLRDTAISRGRLIFRRGYCRPPAAAMLPATATRGRLPLNERSPSMGFFQGRRENGPSVQDRRVASGLAAAPSHPRGSPENEAR